MNNTTEMQVKRPLKIGNGADTQVRPVSLVVDFDRAETHGSATHRCVVQDDRGEILDAHCEDLWCPE